MEDESSAVGILFFFVVIGGIWLVQSLNAVGLLFALVGGILFFGAMLSAGENSDFDAVHDW